MKRTAARLLLGVSILVPPVALAQGTAFSYQGRLNDGGNPASGNYDLQFSLRDAASGGNQVGPTLTNAPVLVSNGVFTVTLDFGAGIFNGSARWLEVGVRTNGSVSGFTLLNPHQAITSTPYAIQAATASTAAAVADNAITSAKILNSTILDADISPTATISDSKLGTIRSAGKVGDTALSANVALLNANQSFTGRLNFNPPAGAPFAVGNSNLVVNLNSDLLDGLDSRAFWKLGGNAGVGTNFIGTTDANALEFKVNNARALRLEPNATSPNFIGGFNGNFVSSGLIGVTIGGGGFAGNSNRVTGSGSYGTIGGGYNNAATEGSATVAGGDNNAATRVRATVGGGYNNLASGPISTVGGGDSNTNTGTYATIPGGSRNSATADYTFAAGRQAKANHPGAFVWADATAANFASSANNQFLVRAGGGVGINATNPVGALDINTGAGRVQFLNEANLTPGLNVVSGPIPGIMRFRNTLEIWPSLDGTRSGSLDVRDTTGATRISLPSTGDASFLNGNVGIGTVSPTAKLEVAGQVKITGGSPGDGKILVSDTNGLATWQLPSVLSVFFGQSYSVLIPDVIDNTAYIEIEGVMQDIVVVINGPGLDIQRISGFQGTNANDQPGPNMEYPFVFEYAGTYSNSLQTWYQQYRSDPLANRKAMSLLVKDLAGVEVGRWNMFEMGPTQIGAGTDGRKRYTLRHALPPDNRFLYQREFTTPANSSKNPATDLFRIEIDGVNQGGYPSTQIDYSNRTVTLIFDYTEAGDIYQWTKNIAEGFPEKKNMSVITEVNGSEVSRRNFFGVFPISFQYTTGFGQVDKLKERVVISFDFWENG